MNLARNLIVAILALCFLYSATAQRPKVDAAAKTVVPLVQQQRGYEPPHIFPNKELYEIEEGETLIITLNVIFPALSGGCIETIAYDALPGTPDFVTVTPTFQREFKKVGNNESYLHQTALLILSPRQGDAGKYEIKIREKLCPQSEGAILPFNVSVKRASYLQRRGIKHTKN